MSTTKFWTIHSKASMVPSSVSHFFTSSQSPSRLPSNQTLRTIFSCVAAAALLTRTRSVVGRQSAMGTLRLRQPSS